MIKDGDELVFILVQGKCYRVFTRPYNVSTNLKNVTKYAAQVSHFKYNEKSDTLSIVGRELFGLKSVTARIKSILDFKSLTYFVL